MPWAPRVAVVEFVAPGGAAANADKSRDGVTRFDTIGIVQNTLLSRFFLLASVLQALAHPKRGALEAAPRGRDLLKLAHCRTDSSAALKIPSRAK
jgi:hypothetical protein